MSSEEEISTDAEHIQHVDVVTNAQKIDIATVVSHADQIGLVEVHGEPIRSDLTRKLSYIRAIARNVVTFLALAVMLIVIYDKNANENELEQQLNTFRSERAASDAVTAKKLECVRRYTDVRDANTEKQLVLIGEFLVIITRIPPGPEREAAVKGKSDELDETNIATRKAIRAKIDYTNKGDPLPCPLGPLAAPPDSAPSDATVTTSPVTPTT